MFPPPMEWNENVTKPGTRERKREKKGRSENQFREVDEEEGGLRITRNV